MKVILIARRWQLESLFTSFSSVILMEELIRSLNDALIAVHIIKLAGVPRDVLVYFWRMVSKYYHRIRIPMQTNTLPPGDYDGEETDSDETMSYETTTDETNIDDTNSVNANIERIRSSFEDVWPLVISHELVHTLVNSIIKTMKRIGIAENNTYADPDPVDGGEIEGLFF